MQRRPSVPSRRSIMIGSGAAALAVILGPRLVAASPAQVEAEINKLYAGKSMAEGKIKLDLPSIAENGLVVPLNFDVESPMTDKDYVKAVHVFADGNPNPGVASFYFTPMMPQGFRADPHAAGADPEHRRRGGDGRRLALHGQERGEGHHRRLRRLVRTTRTKKQEQLEERRWQIRHRACACRPRPRPAR